MDKKPIIAIALVICISAGLILTWKVQGSSMKEDFIEALRAGRVESPHRDLLGKTWSDAELSTVEVIKVVESYGTQRSIERAIHSRGQIVVPAHQFAFQGSVRDGATNIVHVFGYTRTSPSRWCWVTFDAASMQEHLNRRMQQLEDMKKRRPRP